MIAIKGESRITLIKVNPDILNITDNQELNYWLSKLVVEVRKKKDPDTVYPPDTLYQLCCGLQRHMRDNDQPEINSFTIPHLSTFRTVQTPRNVKRLTGMGIESNVKEAQAFSEDEGNKLWNLGLLGDSLPRVLLDTIVFLTEKTFPFEAEKSTVN